MEKPWELQDCTTCLDCGEQVCHGDWPFCKSDQNPDGHKRGWYSWAFRDHTNDHRE